MKFVANAIGLLYKPRPICGRSSIDISKNTNLINSKTSEYSLLIDVKYVTVQVINKKYDFPFRSEGKERVFCVALFQLRTHVF